jgi:dephospho-CoA kinase
MITFICGQLCCGKTSFAKAYANVCDGVYIEIGDIVRRIKQTQDRKILQDSKDLSSEIVSQLTLSLNELFPKQIVASGPRQVDILKAFPEATLLWIECPTKTRKARYSLRARDGDSATFETADQGDVDLGILEVKQYILERK